MLFRSGRIYGYNKVYCLPHTHASGTKLYLGSQYGFHRILTILLHRWNASKENKRKMVEKLENLVRKSCLERTGKEPIGVEVW